MTARWHEIERARKIRKSLDLPRWRRIDVQATRFRKTAPTGPQWPYVSRRRVRDAVTDEVLLDNLDTEMASMDLEASIPGGPRDIVTELY